MGVRDIMAAGITGGIVIGNYGEQKLAPAMVAAVVGFFSLETGSCGIHARGGTTHFPLGSLANFPVC